MTSSHYCVYLHAREQAATHAHTYHSFYYLVLYIQETTSVLSDRLDCYINTPTARRTRKGKGSRGSSTKTFDKSFRQRRDVLYLADFNDGPSIVSIDIQSARALTIPIRFAVCVCLCAEPSHTSTTTELNLRPYPLSFAKSQSDVDKWRPKDKM